MDIIKTKFYEAINSAYAMLGSIPYTQGMLTLH